jgi:hypothetical protein
MERSSLHLRQRGFSFWGIALNVLIFGAFLVAVLRVAPLYVEYLTVKDVIARAGAEYDPSKQGLGDIRTHIRKLLNTSQIYVITADDVEIIREKGKVVIDANYEVRFPLVWIIDGVMKFEDLRVEVDGR